MKAKEFLNKVMRGDKTTIKNNKGIIGFDKKQNEVKGFFVVPSPEFSFDNSTNKMSIECSNENADIYYKKSTDSDWTKYSDSFSANSAATYKAQAKLNNDNYKDSDIVSYELIKIATPVITLEESKCNITCSTSSVTIMVSIDGGQEFYEYTEPFTYDPSVTTIKAYAQGDGMITSDTAEKTINSNE